MIPAQAVEAAAKAMLAMDDFAWSTADPAYVDYFRSQVHKALEAAAPHMTCTHDNEGENK